MRRLAATSGVAVASLIGSGLTIAPLSVADAAGEVQRTPVTSAPDEASAALAARLQGTKVLVDGLSDEVSRTWANPDGSLTSDVYSGPQWVKRDGDWVEIDTTLSPASDGKSVTPVAAGADITLSNGAQDPAGAATPILATVAVAGDAASLSDGAASVSSAKNAADAPADDSVGAGAVSVSVGWSGDLPTPTLRGNEATYADVAPDTDLRVTALPRGVETFVDLTQRPGSIPDEGVTVSLPLSAKGLTVVEDGQGGLQLKDAAGQVLADTPPARVWDAAVDPASGEHAHELVLPTKLVTTSTGYRLDVTVPASFLSDAATSFPVTVDPVATLYASADTYGLSSSSGTNYGSDASGLRVGTYNAGTTKGRAFLLFGSSAYVGTKVTDARLHVYQTSAQSCTASTMIVKRPTASWSESTLTWANMPALDATQNFGSVSAAYGFTGCAANWLNGSTGIDVTSYVDGVAGGSWSNYGLTLVASNETDSNTWRVLASSESADSTKKPYLTVTYDRYPNKASGMVPTTWVDGFVNTTTPTLQLTATDPDGGNVFGQFSIYEGGTQKYPASSFINGSTVTSGQASRWNVPSAAGLVNNGVYHIVAQVADGTVHSTVPTAGTTWTVDNVVPSSTTVSSSAYPANVWTNGPGSATFTLSATDTHLDHYLYGWDTPSPQTPTTGTTSPTLTVPDGWHTLYARAVDAAGNLGAVASYPVGSNAALVTPADGHATQNSLSLTGSSPTTTHLVTFYWRRAATDAWAQVPVANVTRTASPAFAGVWPYDYSTALGNGQSTPGLNFDLKGALSSTNGPAQIGACFGTTASCPASPGTTLPSGSSRPANVTLDLNAFNVAETTGVGPVGVNLLTGNTQLSATDVSVPGAQGTSLSIGRALNTTTAASTPGNAALGSGHYTTTAVFGPGWTGSLPIDSAGSSWTGLVDTGSALTLQAPDQSTVAFTPKPGSSTVWLPTGQDSDSRLTLTSSTIGCASGNRCFTLADRDNVQTLFQTAPATTGVGTLAAPVSFGVLQVTEPGVPDKISFVKNSDLLVTRVTSPQPSGGNCRNDMPIDQLDNTTWTAGCRGLALTYGNGTTGPAGQLLSATYLASTGSAPLELDVACWAYDTNNRLSDEWDPRDIPTASSGIHPITCGSTPVRSTHYTYDSSGRVLTVTPAWNGSSSPLAGTSLAYDATSGRLTSIARAHLDASGTETTQLLYGVLLTPEGSHPEYRPDMSNPVSWGQIDTPDPAVGATAVCPPGSGDVTVTGDLRLCALSYLDADGRVVNTASYSGTLGAGWHISTTEYDSTGHITRTLNAANREEALSPTTGVGADLGLPNDTVAAAAALSTVNQYAPNTTDAQPDLVDTYGPFHELMLANGTTTKARSHTHLAYDTGVTTNPYESQHPTGGSLHLVMSSVTGASQSLDATSVNETDQRTTRSDYEVGTDGSGWTYRTPLQTVTDPSGLNLRSQVVLDGNGRTVQSRLPKDVASGTPGATAGTTKTVYYSAGTIGGADSDCGNQVLYDGLVCKTYPADLNPSGGAPGLITTKTSYDALGRVASVTETPSGDGTHARTTTTVYGFNSTVTGSGTSASSANPWANDVVQTNLTGGLGTALPAQTTTMDSTTGLPTSLSDGTTADSSSYDDFGRLTAYTENTSASGTQGNTANTVYDPTTGRVTSTRDQHRRTSFYYNAGNEFRGLPTSELQEVTTSNNSGVLWSGTFTAGYDSLGRVATQSDPNGITSTLARDETGMLLSRTDKQGSTPWLVDSASFSVHGQQLTHEGPAAEQLYSYDAAGRLTQVQDTSPGNAVGGGQCLTRTYAFDANSNRTSRTVYAPNSTGDCATTTNASSTGFGYAASTTATYDAADRLLATGTLYDTFGRTTTAPVSTVTGGANLTVAYFANDLVASQTQSGFSAQSWTLDQGQQRFRTHTVTGGATETNHYDSTGGDSPDWIAETADGTSWTANVSDLLGSLATTVDQTGAATYQYANLHGDVQATCAAGAGAPTPSPADDEYGNAPTGSAVPRYGWLGGKKRSGEDLAGLILMGVRLYNATSGRFLQTDPVPGGSANSYDYAGQDPLNHFDLDGRMLTGDGGSGGWESGLPTCKSAKQDLGNGWKAKIKIQRGKKGRELEAYLQTSPEHPASIIGVVINMTTGQRGTIHSHYYKMWSAHGKVQIHTGDLILVEIVGGWVSIGTSGVTEHYGVVNFQCVCR